jgi:hypothetical protein
MNMTHYELCKKTAERFSKDANVTLFEYQSYSTSEFPDVLCLGASTTLFEIKMSRQDFKNDVKKDCRIKYKIKYGLGVRWGDSERERKVLWTKYGITELIQEAPHLGKRRYYVCPSGLIQPEEVENGWGLYWFGGKFSKKRESKIFRNNLYQEIMILQHAFRKYAGGKGENIIIRNY